MKVLFGIMMIWQFLIRPIRRKFKHKLFLVFIVVYLLPTFLLSMLSYRMSSQAIIENHIRYKSDIMVQVKTNIEESMNNMNGQSLAIYTHLEDLLTVQRGPQGNNADDYIKAKQRIDNFMEVVLKSNNIIDSLTLISKEGDILYFLDRVRTPYIMRNVVNQPWFQETLALQGSPLFTEARYNE